MTIACKPDGLQLRASGGAEATLDALLLWDNRPENFAPGGQRLCEFGDAPDSLHVAGVMVEGDCVRVAWNAERGETRFPLALLRELAFPTPPTPAPRLWRATDAARLHRAEWAFVVAYKRERLAFLRELATDGIAFLRGVPAQSYGILNVVAQFGFVRETNYGRVFDVRAEAKAANLANTDFGLALHTDNPYRDPVPGLQLLHCLTPSREGGVSLFADGFAAAEELRARMPEYFACLTETPVGFRYRDADCDLRAERPILTLDRRGSVAAVACNHRSMTVPVAGTPETVRTFYRAYREFTRLVASPPFVHRTLLGAGDVVAFDNGRVLHGRTGFSSSGPRHFQGCYADRDGLYSAIWVGEREEYGNSNQRGASRR